MSKEPFAELSGEDVTEGDEEVLSRREGFAGTHLEEIEDVRCESVFVGFDMVAVAS